MDLKKGTKKVLYITNVNIDGKFLPGVIVKIRGQLNAFSNNDFNTDLLFAGNNGKVTLLSDDNKRLEFRGSLQHTGSNFFSKLYSHLKIAWFGAIDFRYCADELINNHYDAVYLRFYLPGRRLITFLGQLKKKSPLTKILLEYPTLNAVTEFKKRDLITRVIYYLNRKRIVKLNQFADYIVTLTKDKILFDKPALFMANGIDISGIAPVATPDFNGTIILLGVASDCAFYHGFDKVIKGLADYTKDKKQVKVVFRLVTNPLSRNVDYLLGLAKNLGVDSQVSFELPKSREELAEEYKKVHLGVGTLAMHRINMMDNYSLKHREYAAFGLPFIMSKGDDYFANCPFVLSVERNEDPLNIQQVVDFYLQVRESEPDYPIRFRNSVKNTITWEAQLKNVFEVINSV